MRSGDIGDEAAWSAEEADAPLDLDAVRADDDLIEALAAGLVPPPSGPRDPDDVEGELVALLAGWVADVRPETLLHRPDRPIGVRVMTPTPAAENSVAPPGSLSLLEYDELPTPVPLSRWRSQGMRPLLLRAAATLVALALVGSAVVAGSYHARPGEPLWLVAQVVFPDKSHSVEAATAVSTALNTARVALERGRLDEAREAIQSVDAQLAAVGDDDGRAELAQQSRYLTAQLNAPTGMTAQQVSTVDTGRGMLAVGQAGAVIRSNPGTTPGATRALSTPTVGATGPAVAAAPPAAPGATAPGATAPGATSPGAPAADAGAPPAVVAAPAPAASDPIASAPPPAASDPAASDPAASAPAPPSGGSASPPPAEDPPPVVSSTTAPPVTQQSQPPPQDPPPVTTVPSSGTGSGTSQDPGYAPGGTTSGSGSGTSQSSGTSSTSTGSSDTSAGGSAAAADVSASVDISTEASVGSTLGAVAGVVSSAENSSS